MQFKSIIYLSTILASNGLAVAYAQDNSETKPTIELEEITVTAERRATNLQSTPLSLTALNAEKMEQIGAMGLEDLQGFIPNFSISADGAYGRSNPQFNIRGVGAGTSTAGIVTERPVALYIDDLFFPRVQGSLLNVLDAQSVEVLRGPQGTLFGRNTTGGAVIYKSKTPTGETGGSVKAKLGNFNERQIQAELNVAIADNLFARAVFSKVDQDGYVQRGDIDLGNVDDTVGRFQIRYEKNDNFTLDMSATYSKTKTKGDARVNSEFLFGGASGPGRHFGALSILLEDIGEAPLTENDSRIITSGYDAPSFCISNNPDPLDFGEECETNLEAELQVYSAKAKWAINDEVTLTSISGHLTGNQESTSDWVWSGAYQRPFAFEYSTWSQELQVNYDTDKLNAVAGAIYFTESGSETEITDEVRVVGGVLTIDDVRNGGSWRRRAQEYISKTESIGAYAQATYHVTEKFALTGGGRMSWDSKDVTIINTATPQDNDVRTGTGKDSWSNFDWRLAAQYQITDDIMFYASVTDAYKAGIADDSSLETSVANNPTNYIIFVPPEQALGYEIGFRSEFFDNRVRFNLTVFKTDYTDRQSRQSETLPNGEIILQTVNLGDVEFKGFEAELTIAASERLTLNGSFGLVDYELIEEPENVLSNIPKVNFTFGLNYDRDVSFGGYIATSLNFAWVGETYGRNNRLPDVTGTAPQVINPSYGKLNGRIKYTPENERWSVAFYMSNITNAYYSSSSSAQNFHIGGGTRLVRTRYVGRPRSYGIELSANF